MNIEQIAKESGAEYRYLQKFGGDTEITFNVDTLQNFAQAIIKAYVAEQNPVAQVEVRKGAIVTLSIQQYAGCDISNGTVQLFTLEGVK